MKSSGAYIAVPAGDDVSNGARHYPASQQKSVQNRKNSSDNNSRSDDEGTGGFPFCRLFGLLALVVGLTMMILAITCDHNKYHHRHYSKERSSVYHPHQKSDYFHSHHAHAHEDGMMRHHMEDWKDQQNHDGEDNMSMMMRGKKKPCSKKMNKWGHHWGKWWHSKSSSSDSSDSSSSSSSNDSSDSNDSADQDEQLNGDNVPIIPQDELQVDPIDDFVGDDQDVYSGNLDVLEEDVDDGGYIFDYFEVDGEVENSYYGENDDFAVEVDFLRDTDSSSLDGEEDWILESYPVEVEEMPYYDDEEEESLDDKDHDYDEEDSEEDKAISSEILQLDTELKMETVDEITAHEERMEDFDQEHEDGGN